MIPRANITEWRSNAPWPMDSQIEQDLIISRAIIELFSNDFIRENLLFRGGTALHKLVIQPPCRYSEDIDLVQRKPEPIGDILDVIRSILDKWLGKAKWKTGTGITTLKYRFYSEIPPIVPMSLKIEINTREHFNIMNTQSFSFSVKNTWFSGKTTLPTYSLEELLATKLRALYQRKKGRDLFDLWLALETKKPNIENLITCFKEYMRFEGHTVSKKEYINNLNGKIMDQGFLSDIEPLIVPGMGYNALTAKSIVEEKLLQFL